MEPMARSSVLLREQRHAPQWFLQHGSSPAPHGLAGESVGVCSGRACVCLGRVLNASPNANARRLKTGGSLLLSLPFFWKGLFSPSGAGVYFLPLQKDGEPERCTCHPFWISEIIDIVTTDGTDEVLNMCFV